MCSGSCHVPDPGLSVTLMLPLQIDAIGTCMLQMGALSFGRASLVAQLVKNTPAMRKTWVCSLGWDDPLEKRKATHSSILAWRIPWTV